MLIISKTPLRMSFVGGGTDLPEFSDRHGGAVVSTTIDKWIRVIVAPRFEGDLRVSYSRTEIVQDAGELRHELIREALLTTGIRRGIEIVTISDVPSGGTGLGSSSAVTVGLLAALHAYRGSSPGPQELAEQAVRIEIEVLGRPVGRQDQYAVAEGGLNLLEFPRGGAPVRIEPIAPPAGTLERLHRSLLLFYTGGERAAAAVLESQRRATQNGSAVGSLMRMRELAYAMRDALREGRDDGVGELLHAGWELKRSIGSASTDEIDAAYESARRAGAIGGKLVGAGQSGFLLLMGPQDRHPAIRDALSHLREVPFRFTPGGATVELLDSDEA